MEYLISSVFGVLYQPEQKGIKDILVWHILCNIIQSNIFQVIGLPQSKIAKYVYNDTEN